MVDIRRKDVSVKMERRAHPRLEFHCTARVVGIKDSVNITDISLGGFFFELKLSAKLRMGQIANVAISLPTENEPMRIKVRLINQTERGVGCAFVDLAPNQRRAIRNCFETFKDTIPIG
ncbi:MAG: PilZ domain-containing protein [Deltaproteobacteria bacterium]|nr:PilZ domain-containing protein [Deltaproteobacteria bacterium]MBW2296656.1 PilZ domain-containing protein [Deltaproteobacteria bacterium]MBW2612461.1 PilZ domain-containing protein [Deltaproteobacteria bacterium]MBW2634249.1 PilZ domain-containing protein [Deltaproteobacteria bacterium]MBW2676347.1 PilZ domain-containing protein [Deltaproteobacteria bacterium]